MSTRRGRYYQEVTAVAAAIAAVAAASKADAEADTAAAGIGAVVAPSQAEADETEAIEAAVIDFDASVELDDKNNMDEGVNEADGEADVVIGAGGESATATTEGMVIWEGWRGRGLPRSVSVR